MTNTLTGLIPIIYQARDQVAREMIGLIPAVTIDAQATQAALNQTVRSPYTVAAALSNIVPGATVPSDAGQTVLYRDLTISNSQYAPVVWTGEEQRSVGSQYENIIKDQFVQAFRALANAVEKTLLNTAVNGASQAVGTPGTTPFGTAANLSDFANVTFVLDSNGAPMEDRHLVLGPSAWQKIRGVQSTLFKVNEAGTDELLRKGIVAQVENLALHNSQQISAPNKHVFGGANTAAAYKITTANVVGDTVLTANSGSTVIVPGDVIAFAGSDPTQYVVGANGASTITLNSPGLVASLGTSNTYSCVAGSPSYIPNIGLHKGGVLLAARSPLMPAGGDAASDVIEVEDPVSGLVFQIAMYKTYRQINIQVGLAWGALAVKPEFITILMG